MRRDLHRLAAFSLVFVISISLFAAVQNDKCDPQRSLCPKDGFVPDEKTAVSVAEAVLVPIYGKQVLKERPFVAQLQDGVWNVHGTLPKSNNPDIVIMGGTAHVEIDKQSGRIVSVYHMK